MRLPALVTILLICGSLAASPTKDEQAAVAELGARLQQAYPESIRSVRDGVLYFANGKSLPIGSSKTRSVAELQRIMALRGFKGPPISIAEMFVQPYPRLGTPIPSEEQPPAPQFDPGRYRCEAFFTAMYGDEDTIERTIEKVPWLHVYQQSDGKMVPHLLVTRINGVAAKIAAIREELRRLPEATKRAMRGVVFDPRGPKYAGFGWRKIRKSSMRSAHSWGIAIDLNEDTRYYHLDSKVRYTNNIRQEIVDIFERHGFISGTRWAHFDSMHFEYRPELFLATDRSRLRSR